MVQKKWVGEDKVSAVISCFSDTDGSDSRHLRETCVCVCVQSIQEIFGYTLMQWCISLQAYLSCMNNKNYDRS